MRCVISFIVASLLSHVVHSRLSRSDLRQAISGDPVSSHVRDGIPVPQNVNLADFVDMGIALPDTSSSQIASQFGPQTQPGSNMGPPPSERQMQPARSVSTQRNQLPNQSMGMNSGQMRPVVRTESGQGRGSSTRSLRGPSGQATGSNQGRNSRRRQSSGRQRPRNRQNNRRPRVNSRGPRRNQAQNQGQNAAQIPTQTQVINPAQNQRQNQVLNPVQNPTQNQAISPAQNPTQGMSVPGQQSPSQGSDPCPNGSPVFNTPDRSMTQTQFDQQMLRPALQILVQGCDSHSMKIYLHWLLLQRERLFNI